MNIPAVLAIVDDGGMLQVHTIGMVHTYEWDQQIYEGASRDHREEMRGDLVNWPEEFRALIDVDGDDEKDEAMESES